MVKLRSKKILCTADVPSSSDIWKRTDVYPPALINAENVNVCLSSNPTAPVSNVSMLLSNVVVPESNVSNAVRV